ncbi:hypothetical protein P872_01800 [Rhodonellum psychrophilum GCM71 = DSM 17998]|uniref:DUF4382 domain-containing protein n=2 Tax=Rhodonellum TaxID=336827 RepID=U5C6D9_9BACT|nr:MULTISPECIES: DUF4382 domain-containing protein [Rhodonellum]ERM83772.1 hypothetical protein P872_01800 [Rhodonellum psychrophilum GCM71 = DSM 17998]SDY64863.1 protein of unknown function [Rhodonellum ikkaensis]
MKNKLLSIFILFFLFNSCTTEDAERSKALVNIYLVDSTVSFEEIWVELLGVEVQVTGTRGQDNANPEFLPYTPSEKKVNLSALLAGNQLLVGRGEFMLGAITKMTLKLGTDNYILRKGVRTPLVFKDSEGASPSVSGNFNLSPGISHDYYLDLNLDPSAAAGSGINRTINPKIQAFSKLETGEIGGTLVPRGLKAILFAIQNSDTIRTSVDSLDAGKFLFRGLNGKYFLLIHPTDVSYKQVKVDSVLAVPGKSTALGTITLEKIKP